MPEARPETSAGTKRNLFVLHVLQLLLGLGAMQPLSYPVCTCCWEAFLAVSAIHYFYKSHISNERPVPEHAPGAIDQQRRHNPASADEIKLSMYSVFLGKPPVPLMIVPEWILALYHAVEYAGTRFGSTRTWQQYGAKLQRILSAYQEQILILSAVAEIAAGLTLLLLMVHRPWKFLLLAVFYCGVHLPYRCIMPESAAYHRQVWRVIATVARPLLQLAPVLQILVENVKNFHQWSIITLLPS